MAQSRHGAVKSADRATRKNDSRTFAVITGPARLSTLRRTGLLDSPPEECFDQLTRVAAQALHASAAFLSLVDEESDFYKSMYGFGEPLASTRRMSGETFCHYAMVADGPLIIGDTRAHETFRRVPTVATHGVAAYIGIPLISPEGHQLGAFCAIDVRPRVWTGSEVDTMLVLARAAMREIVARSTSKKPAATEPAESGWQTEVLERLSPRELEVMKRMLHGQRLKQIAAELDVSVKTIATHRSRLLNKLNLGDNHELLRFAVEHRLVDWA